MNHLSHLHEDKSRSRGVTGGKSFKKAKEEERQRFHDYVWGKSDVGKLTGRVRLGRDGKKERESGRV